MQDHGDFESVYALAFETSSALGSVALGRGEAVIETRPLSGPRRHAVEFLPTIDALCVDHGVEASAIQRVFVSSGPGSFTGLRIGMTAARMLAMANGAKVVSVPTLDVIAQNALEMQPPPNCLAVVLDAKRNRVYAAAFVLQDDRYVAVTDPAEVDPGQFLADRLKRDRSCAVLGEGVLYHRAAIDSCGAVVLPEAFYAPRAETVYRLGAACAKLGQFVDRRELIPTYVRPPEAEEKWESRHSSGPNSG